MSPEEGLLLQSLSKGKKVLEIGALCGRSTVAMAEVAESIVTIDWFRNNGIANAVIGEDGHVRPETHDGTDALGLYWSKLKEFRNVCTIIGESQVILPLLPTGGFDLLFVDGDHSEVGCRSDYTLGARMVKEDGVIAFHDYDLSQDYWVSDVPKVVDEIIASGDWREVTRAETLIALERVER